MRTLCTACAAAVLALWAPSLHAQAPQAAPADKGFGEQVDVNVVNVEVYVTDAKGNPVNGLQRGDFTLLEDGKPMQIVNFEAVDRNASAAAPAASTSAPAPVAGTPAAEAAAAPPAPAADPLHLVVYIDNTHLAAGHRTRVLQQLRDFLTRRLAPGDAVMLATYDPGLHVRLPFSTDRDALSRALDTAQKMAADGGGDDRARRAALQQVVDIQERALQLQKKQDMRSDKISLRPGAGGPGDDDTSAPEFPPCPPEIAEPVKSYAQQSRQEVLRSVTGLTVLVNSLSGLPGRKAVLHVSDGLSVTPGEELFQALFDMCGGGAATQGGNGATVSVDSSLLGARVYKGTQAMLDAQSYSTAKQWNDLAAHASAQRVTLYTLQATGLEAGAAADMGPGDRLLQSSSVAHIEQENRRGSLTALASGTGGRAIFDANDLRPDIARIENDLGHYYSLGYTPKHTGDGKDHTIAVKVQRPDVHVRHRQLYRDKPALERAVDRTLAALLVGTGDNPLGITLEVGDMVPAPLGAAGSIVPIRLLIPLNNVGLTLHGEGYDGKLRVFVATMSGGGGNSPVRQLEVPLRIPMQNSQATMMQNYLYELKLQLPPGEHRVAVGIRDDITTLASFLSQKVSVAGGASR